MQWRHANVTGNIPVSAMGLLWLPVTSFTVYYLFSLLGRALRRHFLLKQTYVKNIDALGLPRTAAQKIRGTAVICGGR